MISSIAHTKYFIQHYSFICTQLSSFKYCNQMLIIIFKISHLFAHSQIVSNKGLISSLRLINENLTGPAALDQRRPGSNRNKGLLNILQISGTGASTSSCLVGPGRIGNRRISQDHKNYSIVEFGQNTKKSSGDLRKLAVTKTPVKNQQLPLVRKIRKEKTRWRTDYSHQKQYW